jgi:NAD(P)-dependent dehydrogenase (short-subunit alcohol dehydrogenase family)
MQKNILITGGSSGIGEGIARHFFNKGWQVMVTGRNKDRLSNLKKEMPGLHIMEYDNQKDNQETNLIDFVRTQWDSKLDVLVNNAGHVALGELKNITEESMQNMYRAHLIAPALLSSGCIDFLAATKGQILNVTSSHGIKPYAQISAYGSAKAAANMLTKIWALELAPLGIRVNAIAPGPTETGILSTAGFSVEMIQAIHESEIKSIPLQRRGTVDDIVANAALLIDSGSTWVTGVIMPVDGGISIN